jgi:hypothetical protein
LLIQALRERVEKESAKNEELARKLEKVSRAEVGAGGRALPKHLVRSMSEVSPGPSPSISSGA